MKRFLTILIAMMMVMGITSSAMAASYDVRTAITSPAVTGVENVCEKYGAVTFTFGPGTIFTSGDSFYFDLPYGSSLCHTFDFVIAGINAITPAGAATAGLWGSVSAPHGSETTTSGPWILRDKGTIPGPNGVTFTSVTRNVAGVNITTTGMFFRVTGEKGGRRVNFTVYDDGGTGIYNIGAGFQGSTLQLHMDAELTLTMFDGAPHRAYLFKDTFVAPAVQPNGIYGDVPAPGIDTLQSTIELNWENSICAELFDKEAALENKQLVNVSFDSNDINNNDFLTFQGQREIAHVMVSSITTAPCNKDACGLIDMAQVQGNKACTFDNDNNLGYCAPPPKTNPSNKIILHTSGAFDINEAYMIEARILVDKNDGNGYLYGDRGVYFSNFGVRAGDYLTQALACVGGNQQILVTNYRKSDGTLIRTPGVTMLAHNNGCNTILPEAQATYLLTQEARIFRGQTNTYLYIDMPTFVYDPSVIERGYKVKIEYSVLKSPCGVFFKGEHCIGTFGCTNIEKTTLLYPYYTSINNVGDDQFWDGIAITNIGDSDADATITAFEADGTIGTATITVNKHSVFADVLSNINFVKDPTSPGTFGDDRCYVVVCANFNADGFAMFGDGDKGESLGYIPRGTTVSNPQDKLADLCP